MLLIWTSLTTLEKKPFEINVEDGENAGNYVFYFIKEKFLATFSLSSANAFSLD